MARLPVRVGICGDWMDHPMLNGHHPGCVVNASLWQTMANPRHGGLATSTAMTAEKIWGDGLPDNPDRETLAKTLFGAENVPDPSRKKLFISGSQDAYGIVYPGINRLYYDNGYLPVVESVVDEGILAWAESVLYLIPTHDRNMFYEPVLNMNGIRDNVKLLAAAGDVCWSAILRGDVRMLGLSMNECRAAQSAIMPGMYDIKKIDWFPNDIIGWKYSGAGGGGYVVAVSEKPLEKGIRLNIRRENGR